MGFCFGDFVTKFVYVCAYKEKRPEGNTHTQKLVIWLLNFLCFVIYFLIVYLYKQKRTGSIITTCSLPLLLLYYRYSVIFESSGSYFKFI